MSRDFHPRDTDPEQRETPTPDGRTLERPEPEIQSPELSQRGSASLDPRDPSRNKSLDVPSPDRQQVLYEHDRGYRLTTREIRIIADLGTFRAIDRNDLAKYIPAENAAEHDKAIDALLRQGLARRATFEGPEGMPRELLTLTRRGHRLLRANRLVPTDQPTYYGFVKPREANHDADLYALYQKETGRIGAGGGRVRRVLLDFELKRKINRDLAILGLQARPEIAARHGLHVVRDKIPVPDLQIEYDTRGGDVARVNLELVTEHYRGRHVGDKVRAGFALYTLRGEGDHLRRILDQQELTAEILSL